MIETTDSLWPVCSPANNLPEGKELMLWIGRGESCAPQGAAGAAIVDLLFCLPPWPSWGFPKPRIPLPSPSSPIPLLFILGSGILWNGFSNNMKGKGAISRPLIANPEVSYLFVGFSFLKGVCAAAGPWAAIAASWWDQALLSVLLSPAQWVSVVALPLSTVLSPGQRWFVKKLLPCKSRGVEGFSSESGD